MEAFAFESEEISFPFVRTLLTLVFQQDVISQSNLSAWLKSYIVHVMCNSCHGRYFGAVLLGLHKFTQPESRMKNWGQLSSVILHCLHTSRVNSLIPTETNARDINWGEKYRSVGTI